MKKDLNAQLLELRRQVEAMERSLQSSDQADAKSTEAISISEGALLQYIIEMYDLDLENIKHKILPPLVAKDAMIHGDGYYSIISHSVEIKNNRVVRSIPVSV